MMTSAEFKCLRESMGLPTKWLAIRWHVAESSVKRWETNRILPDELERDLRRLKKLFDGKVSEIADDTELMIVPRVNEEAGAYPASWHRAIAQRASERTGCRILFLGDEQL